MLTLANVCRQYTGYFYAPVAGTYTFSTSSDDGSNLYMAGTLGTASGTLVVNNNFEQGTTQRTGTVSLSAGLYTIAVYFFQNGGGYVRGCFSVCALVSGVRSGSRHRRDCAIRLGFQPSAMVDVPARYG